MAMTSQSKKEGNKGDNDLPEEEGGEAGKDLPAAEGAGTGKDALVHPPQKKPNTPRKIHESQNLSL